MGTAHEHREKREIALSLAYAGLVEACLDILPIEDILLERINEYHWSIVHAAWRSHPERKHLKVDLNWWRQRNKRRDKLDVSIWCGEHLCGMFLAKLSRKRVNVALRFLESNPNETPLNGYMIPIGLIIAESFARAYGAMEVMVSQPDRLLIPLYREQGYDLTPADQSRERRSCNIRAKVLVKKLTDSE